MTAARKLLFCLFALSGQSWLVHFLLQALHEIQAILHIIGLSASQYDHAYPLEGCFS
jgi:hypothetical protein